MSRAFLALWNDYPAAMAEEYEAWHTFEHVPERLTPPGMLAARRYISSNRRESYFTFYELEDLAAIEHPAYLDLVRNPTPWSLKMRQNFSNVLRIPAEIVAGSGQGIGSCAIAQAYSVDREAAQAAVSEMEAALQEMLASAHILGFRIGIAEPNQIYEVFAQAEMTDPDTVNVVMLIEGTSRPALIALKDKLDDFARTLLKPRKCLSSDVFDLLISYRSEEFPSDRSEIAKSPTLQSQIRQFK